MKRILIVTCLTVGVVATLVAATTHGTKRAPLELWGFTGPWDPRSAQSVRQHGAMLDVLVTGWIGLDSASARPIIPTLYPDTLRTPSGGVERFAIVTSWHGQRFHPETIRRLASDRILLGVAASAIARHVADLEYAGLVLDFEELGPADVPALMKVADEIGTSAKRAGARRIAIAVPALDTAGYPARRLLDVADLVLVMLYDQHWATSEPGPISDPSWVRQALAMRIAEAGADRLVAGFPTYGYRWVRGRPTEQLSFADAQRIAARTGALLHRDAGSQTLTASRSRQWELWVTDAALLRGLQRDASALGVRRMSLWRLGQEDPAFWAR